MAKISQPAKQIGNGSCGSIAIAVRERTVPRSSADYVFAGGKGEAAYKLTKIIEGSGKRWSQRSLKTGAFLGTKTAS